jgi:HEAT repeat protein
MNGQVGASPGSSVLRAASTRAGIEHPNLLGVRVASADYGRVTVLIERCTAPTLAEVLSRGPLTVSDLVPIVRDIASAVNTLARHGLVAHDLTPARILLHPSRGPVLADPGIPLMLVRRAPEEADRDRPYRSPEELDGRSVDARSNVYSFGAILFAALVGTPPPESGRVRRPRRRRVALAPPIAAVIARAMAKEPKDRYSDVEELRHAALAAFGGEHPAPSERPQPDPSLSEPEPARRRPSNAASSESRSGKPRSGFGASRRRSLRALAQRPQSSVIPDERAMKPLRNSHPDVHALLGRKDIDGLVQAAGFTDIELDAEGHPVDKGMGIREQAILALGELGPEVGGLAVAGALRDSFDCVRSAAVHVLHSRGETGLLAEALSSLPPDGAKSRGLAFQAILEHPSSRVARTAARALIRAPGHLPLPDADAAFMRTLVGRGDRGPANGALRELLEALRDDRSEVAERAEDLLVVLAPASTPGVIAELEKDRSPERAATILGRTGDSRAMQPLIGALEHRRAGVRLQAAAALGALRDPAGVEPLLRATHDSDFDVRAEASHALDHMGAVGVVVGMSALLRSTVMEAVGLVAELAPPDRTHGVVPEIAAPAQTSKFVEAREVKPLPDDWPEG